MSEESKEISLKDLIKRFIAWIKFLFSKWLIIGIVSAIGAGLGVVYAFMAKPQYSASISFVLSSQNEAGAGLMGLASQFGLDLSGSSTDAFSGDNIIALMSSRKMLQQVLLQKPDGKETLLNTLCKDMKMDKGWAENERTKKDFSIS